MSKEVSNQVVIILVAIALLVSLVSTYIVTVYAENINSKSPAQNQVKTIIVQNQPPATGYISLNIQPKKESNPK
jgi:hypothetical protein